MKLMLTSLNEELQTIDVHYGSSTSSEQIHVLTFDLGRDIWSAVKSILMYLHGTKTNWLFYGKRDLNLTKF